MFGDSSKKKLDGGTYYTLTKIEVVISIYIWSRSAGSFPKYESTNEMRSASSAAFGIDGEDAVGTSFVEPTWRTLEAAERF